MPKLQTPLITEDLTQLEREVKKGIMKVLGGVVFSVLSKRAKDGMIKSIDNIVKDAYRKNIERNKKMEEFDFNRAMIASRFGVHPSKVTDKFLKEKLAEARRNADAFFSAREKQLGVKIAPDTEKSRREIMKRVRKIIAATPK